MLRIGIVAGEASGDLLGEGLIKELKAIYPLARFRGIGGPRMQALGFESLFPMERLSVMGLIGPSRLVELLRMRSQLGSGFIAEPPDVFIGIDAPDFNLGLEKRLRAAGIPVVHYVSPSVWAWRRYRIHKIRKAVDLMLTLLPFEADFYRRTGVPVTFVGHPLASHIPLQVDQAQARTTLGLPHTAKVIAFLPGSRISELKYLAPLMLETAHQCSKLRPDLHFVVPFANAHTREYFENIQRAYPNIPTMHTIDGRSQLAMTAADLVVLASGTATLEAALLKKPMVVTYKMGAVSYRVYKALVKVAYIALPNLLAGRSVVPELIQEAATPESLTQAIFSLLNDTKKTNEITQIFTQIHHQLAQNADRAAAHAVSQLLKEKGIGDA